jgi:hypothetical protein
MIVLPSLVNEYSKALALDLVARRVINPVDSRLRRVLVSMCWETFSALRRNSPCRQGLSFSEKRIFGVHLPIKIGPGFSMLGASSLWLSVFLSVLDIT